MLSKCSITMFLNHALVSTPLNGHVVSQERLTALCWAQALSPSLAGLLSLRLGLDNQLVAYIKVLEKSTHSFKWTFSVLLSVQLFSRDLSWYV